MNQVNLFIGFGVVAMIGLLIMLLFMGPLVKNKELHQYVEGDSTPILQP